MSFETFEKLPAEKKEMILSAGIGEFSRKSYKDASTDIITKTCQISKGILFHYFGSKKEFYLYCLEKSLERLTENTGDAEGTGFYEILLSEIERKISLCRKYGDEMRMVNMAGRDASAETAQEKAVLMRKYTEHVHGRSAKTLRKAVAALDLKDVSNEQIILRGLQIYISAIVNQYLLQYQQMPDQFFENSESIQKEIREYLDLFLKGICR